MGTPLNGLLHGSTTTDGLTVAPFARAAGVREPWVRKMASLGLIPHRRDRNGCRIFDPADVPLARELFERRIARVRVRT
jgi:hypothetical protein